LREIRIHGRGGQGAVTAAKILGEAAISEGKWAQKSAVYGGERRGAPVQAFIRIDNKPIRDTHNVIEPDCIIVIDTTLSSQINVCTGLKPDGYAIIHSTKEPAEIKLETTPKVVSTLDALSLSVEIFGPRSIPIVNTSMLGSFARTTGWVELESLSGPIIKNFGEMRGEQNIRAARLGFERTNSL
jgi:2-oxoacid:acceptor oxidoreductase gamma subunit (pyruvate/2-ketoisovalerate family)